MNIKVRENSKIAVLDLDGKIDINASNFVETVGWILANKSKEIVCNFKNVISVDYVGVSLLAVAYKNVINHKGRMRFFSVSDNVEKLFMVVGLDRVFDCYDTEEDVVKSFSVSDTMDEVLRKKLRRRFKRITVREDFDFKPKFSSSAEFFKGKIINISALGIFSVSDKIFTLGDILLLRLYILSENKYIEVDAKVVWIADKEIQPLESPAMGLEFYKISGESQEAIIDFVDKNLASEEFEKNGL